MINDEMIIAKHKTLNHSFSFAGYWTMFIAIISVVVHEISVAVLDLLLLSSFINYISSEYEHIPSAWAEDGQSFRSLQVSTNF